MSLSINKVQIVGYCGKPAELRTFPNGGRIAMLNVATTEKWKDRQSGERREETEWHRVVCGDRLVNAAQYCVTGTQVYVEGRLRTRKWQGQDGQDRYATEIVAMSLQLGSSPKQEQSPAQAAAPAAAAKPAATPARQRARAPAAAKAVAQPTTAPATATATAGVDDDEPF